MSALRLTGVRRAYGSGEAAVTALDGVSLDLATGSFTAVMGPSGSGKTTLLHCAAGLERPDSGLVEVNGEPMPGGSETRLTRFRRERIGFVFQQYNLLPTLTALQNATLPLTLAGKRVDRARAIALLEEVGLGDRLHHRPDQLSGGQRQRVAVARALVTAPSVVFADEPTGALDTRSARDVLALLRSAVDRHGRTVVMVTHDPVAASYADSVIFLADGRLDPAGELRRPSADAIAARLAHLGDQAVGTGV
ncbi:ABC transporter ATP-binding protein [Actinoplanes utahensis]|uniref:ABC transporter n=1 Tax=Actinoplanes utahensis TaxID=1869 RepID=A0A0A6WX73_ACTUT|nr:ABC transporter ATP-binding protein [Actinoplanes utahensis]KHD72277.1 ABC transporter [Actinoplanes utahensis]GIF35564.1 ABC transporter ATP-binding protein [Actinoplanes utahensis]